jgi:hypothetical protein
MNKHPSTPTSFELELELEAQFAVTFEDCLGELGHPTDSSVLYMNQLSQMRPEKPGFSDSH